MTNTWAESRDQKLLRLWGFTLRSATAREGSYLQVFPSRDGGELQSRAM